MRKLAFLMACLTYWSGVGLLVAGSLLVPDRDHSVGGLGMVLFIVGGCGIVAMIFRR